MASPSLERRVTKFPGNSGVHVLAEKRNAQDNLQASSCQLLPDLPIVPRTLQKQQKLFKPPALPLPVNPDSHSFSLISVNKRRAASPARRGSPWENYEPFLTEDQAGPVTVAYRKELDFSVVTIKRCRPSNTNPLKAITRTSHQNIVCFMEAFLADGELFTVYESMAVSLAEVQSSPCGNFYAYEIAALCKEVLQGLHYIHQELHISYNHLNVTNILLSADGNIKLANIADSMLQDHKNEEAHQKDARALGLLMIRMMELSTSLEDPVSLRLKEPERWKEPEKEFLEKSAVLSVKMLLSDPFLDTSPGCNCLKPKVLITQRSVQKEWQLCVK